MKKFLLVSLAVALLSVMGAQAAEDRPGASAAPSKADQADPGDEIVARGKGISVKRRQLVEAFTAFKASAAARGQTIPEAERPKVEAGILERLVVTRILVGKATAEDKAKGKEQADKVVGSFRDQARTEERFAAQLKAMGLTEEAFRGQVLDQAVCEQVLDRELRAKLSIADDQARKFYNENEAQFQEPERVRAAHVLISTQDLATGQSLSDAKVKEKKELAEKVLARAKSGEDFTKLAKEFSDDPGSKDSGGEYTFPRGQMVPEFEAAAFSMKTNQISDLVTTKYGFHIIRLNEKLPARKVEFAKVEKDIKEYLTDEELKQQLPGYFEKIKTEAGVEIEEERLKTTETLTLGLLGRDKAHVDAALKDWNSHESKRSTKSKLIYLYTKDVEVQVHFKDERAVGVAVIDRPGADVLGISQARFEELVKLIGQRPDSKDIKRDSDGIREFYIGDVD